MRLLSLLLRVLALFWIGSTGLCLFGAIRLQEIPLCDCRQGQGLDPIPSYQNDGHKIVMVIGSKRLKTVPFPFFITLPFACAIWWAVLVVRGVLSGAAGRVYRHGVTLATFR